MLYLWLMDKELEHSWNILPRVRIDEYESMLTVNHRFVSLPDITPSMLTDFINIGHDVIDKYLNETTNKSKYWNEFEIRPSLLLGRFALAGPRHRARILTPSGLDMADDEHLSKEDLRQSYKGYWEAVRKTDFVPEVYVDIALSDPHLDGTWLGLRQK